jgi:hypothetical protein
VIAVLAVPISFVVPRRTAPRPVTVAGRLEPAAATQSP